MRESNTESTDLTELLLNHLLRLATGDEFVDWAMSALQAGMDSTNLRILASLGSSVVMSEAEVYFNRALKELNIERPSEEKIIRDYVRAISNKILSDQISPELGADLIHNRVLSPFNHPNDLKNWCYLSGGLHPENFRELTTNELKEAIKKQAAQTLANTN